MSEVWPEDDDSSLQSKVPAGQPSRQSLHQLASVSWTKRQKQEDQQPVESQSIHGASLKKKT